jgi:AbrB family looped-hinge helix DNA binding protein
MVTFNGRITLPPHVRNQLGLQTGDSVEFVEIGNGRFAIASGVASSPTGASEANLDPQGWVPRLDFSPSDREPGFHEPDDLIQ